MSEPQADYPLARLTTVRTGGAADHFATAGSLDELRELLAWAIDRGLDVNVVGSGSNLLVADAGVRGLVLKLDRELARIEPDGEGLRCGGGARLPAVAARAAALGLGGIEFARQHPGHRGRRRADERERLRRRARRRARVGRHRHRGGGRPARRRRSSASPTAARRCCAGEIVASARFALDAGQPRRRPRAILQSMRERRHAAQPKGIRTFGSTFKNPPGQIAGQLLADAGATALRVGGARFARKHANFVENAGDASTTDVIELIVAGRALVAERFGIELEPEVQLLGDVRFPW